MSLLNAGTFPGRFAGHPMSFNIQGLHPNRGFDGVATFTGGPFEGQSFGFAGNLAGDGSLHMQRDTAEGLQIVDAGPPELRNGSFVWDGSTTGVGIGGSLPFELRL
jgi:hypothetical protein